MGCHSQISSNYWCWTLLFGVSQELYHKSNKNKASTHIYYNTIGKTPVWPLYNRAFPNTCKLTTFLYPWESVLSEILSALLSMEILKFISMEQWFNLLYLEELLLRKPEVASWTGLFQGYPSTEQPKRQTAYCCQVFFVKMLLKNSCINMWYNYSPIYCLCQKIVRKASIINQQLSQLITQLSWTLLWEVSVKLVGYLVEKLFMQIMHISHYTAVKLLYCM